LRVNLSLWARRNLTVAGLNTSRVVLAIASEIQLVLPGCYTWQAYCSSAKVELTSHLLNLGAVSYLVDPIRLDKTGLAELEEVAGNISAILLTNGNHERDAAFYRDRYTAPIYAHPEAAAEFSCTAEDFPDDWECLEIVLLPGAGLGEIGIYVPVTKLLVLGDIIINLDSFAFAPLPDKYATDPKLMRQSIRSLGECDIQTLCFAHGLPMTTQAKARLLALGSV
jgi:glyoxylase-like metal-dependent hydrolase (beta-lactamase superfamily II)